MTIPSITIAAVAALAFVIAWLLSLYAVPGHLLSVFRYRLWQVRDAIVDDVLGGRLPDCPEVREEIAAIERRIAIAPITTMYTCMAVMIASRLAGSESADWAEGAHDCKGQSELSEHEEARLEGYRTKCFDMMARHVMFETPSGWISLVLLYPVFCAVAIIRSVAGVAKPLRESKRACFMAIARASVDVDRVNPRPSAAELQIHCQVG